MRNSGGVSGFKILAFLLPAFLIPFSSQAREDIPNENRIYSQSVFTLLMYKQGFEMSAPVIRLNSTEKLVLTFDDLRDERVDYHYTIRHCSANWETTADLQPSEYINGLRDDDIIDSEYSFNTTVSYVHYTLTLPNPRLQPRISGNYLLIVWSDDPQRPDFTCRFMVFEPSTVGITAEVAQSDRIEDRFTHQQVNFRINLAGFPLMDPKREVKVVILQNDRWDNALYVPGPLFVRGSELDYWYDERNSFPGGNEFRNLDLKSLRAFSERVRKIEWNGNSWQVWLYEDINRSAKNYISDSDINGRTLIKSDDYNSYRPEVESDYAWVRFTFPMAPPPEGTTLCVFGGLTNWSVGAGNTMQINPGTRKYELDLFLKQGFYNYMYVLKNEGSPEGEMQFTEGNHWETENQYMILVYLHELGGFHDRLIAIHDINSRPNR